MARDYYYWCDGGMTVADMDGYFRLVEFDELGYSVDPMTEDDLEAEMMCYANEFGMTEAQVREYFADRVCNGDERDYRWEKYLQGERLRG